MTEACEYILYKANEHKLAYSLHVIIDYVLFSDRATLVNALIHIVKMAENY